MKPKVYIETTIVSYLTAWPSRDVVVAAHQQITDEWWRTKRQDFELFASQLVMREAQAGNEEMARKRMDALKEISVLEITEEAIVLSGIISQQRTTT